MADNKKIVFISDLHISRSESEIEQRFLSLLEKINLPGNEVYILGDWFDIWLRDGINLPDFPHLVQSIKTATSEGLIIYFMPGNRDFLLGSKFTEATGIKIIPDPYRIILDDKTILLTHGDRLCTDDKFYQRYMKTIQNPLSKFILKILPQTTIKFIARKLITATNQSKTKKAAYIMDVNQAAVARVFKDYDILIHGHTHRPGVHQHKDKIRLVLSDWNSRAQVALFDGKDLKLVDETQI